MTPNRKDFEDVLFVLYKMFPQGICAGGYPRDILTGCQPKDIDFWLPPTTTLDDVTASIPHDWEVVSVHGLTSEYATELQGCEHIVSVVKLLIPTGVQVDVVTTIYEEPYDVVNIYTDNLSMCICAPNSTGFEYKWVDGIPSKLWFSYENMHKHDPTRITTRVEKIQAKWDAWVQKGQPVCA